MHGVAREVQVAGTAAASGGGLPGRSVFSACGNPRCATGWLRLWRNRRVPGFEGRWACSAACMGDLVAAAIRREMDSGMAGPHAHRLPVGLLLLEQGRISVEQLRKALEEQREAGEGGGTQRLGEWLVERGVLDEAAVTRALSAQWNCPVLSPDGFDPGEVAGALPRFLAEATGALPIRVAGGRLLYLAFASGVDRRVAAALEAMTDLKVVAGIAPEAAFARAHRAYLETPGPRAHFLEAGSSWLLARALTGWIEAEKPVEARLRRVHGWFWLRMWRQAPSGSPRPGEVEDVIGTVGQP
jgi:hypothetical protein